MSQLNDDLNEKQEPLADAGGTNSAPDSQGVPGEPDQGAGQGETALPAPGENIGGGVAEPEATQDSGLGAGFLDDEDLSEQTGLPVDEAAASPALAMDDAPGFTEASYMPADFLMHGGGSEAPKQIEYVEAQEDMVKLFVTHERLMKLWERADEAEKNVTERVYSQQTARTLQDQIKFARNELMGGKDHYEDAARFVSEVEYRVVQVERNRAWARMPGSLIFMYELIAAIILISLFITFFRSTALVPGSSDLTYLAVSILVGGFGGVMGSWISLVKHIAIDQDFENQHAIWYYTSPLMGLGVGAFIFMVMRVGFISLMSTDANISSPYLFYILSFLGGYQHNIFTDMVKRVLKVFENTGDSNPKNPEGEETQPGPSATDKG